MDLFSNRIHRSRLKPGDHIYSWRTAYIYGHHGIYVGDYKVVHFTRSGGQEIGSGTILDWFVSSVPVGRETLCPNCHPDQLSNAGGVVSSCLDCFLAGGDLYRFQYSVSAFHFIAKARGGTCTLASSDSNEVVVERAKFLLTNGFTAYNLFKNNCEDFAVYCKTGLLAVKGGLFGQSGQPISVVGGPLTAVASASLELIATYGPFATNGCAMLAGFGVYSFSRYMVERKRTCIMKVEAEDLMRGLATGSIQVIEADLRKSSKISGNAEMEKYFLDLCLREAKSQGQKRVSLTQDSWKRLEKDFNTKWNVQYAHKNFEDHYDYLRADYVLWVKITELSGHGFSGSTNTILWPPEKWNEVIEQYPKAEKFRNNHLENIEMLKGIFESTLANGAAAWTPASSEPPPSIDDSQVEDHTITENSVAVINNQLEKEKTCKGPSLSDVIDVLKELKNLGVLSAQGYRKAKVSFCDKAELRLAFMDEENIIDRMKFLNEIFGI